MPTASCVSRLSQSSKEFLIQTRLKPHNSDSMERQARSSTSQRSPKGRRGVRKGPSPAPTERRRHKAAVRPVETAAEQQEHGKHDEHKPASTVVNVDTVRDAEDHQAAEGSVGLPEWEQADEGLKRRTLGICEWLLTGLALLAIILSFPLSIWLCVTVVRQHERAVVFRLGHLLDGKPRGPGLLFYIPFLDVCQKVDIRLKALNIASHTVVTKDLVSTELSAVCYYRIENVSLCFTALSGVSATLQTLFQLCDREVLAHYNFTQILLERREVTKEIQVAVDAVTSQWGIKVERAEIEDIHLPTGLQQSVAAEAEAKRLAQIKVIAAEGEKAACEALKASLDSLSGSPAAVHLRLLQLLHTLRSEHPAIVLSLPSDILALHNHVATTAERANHAITTAEANNKSPRDSPMM